MKKQYLEYIRIYVIVILGVLGVSETAHAQLGSGWVSYSPTKKIHLDDESGLQTFNWTASKSVCSPVCADYNYTSSNDTETFRLFDNRTNRSEIRLQNEYSTGSRQFEGYVTFYAPLDDESLMQIFGSTSGATQMMIRGYAADGGSMRGAGQTLATNIYGVELRVNVIHLQEDAGNKILIYINGVKKAEIADNEAVTNYHKYGNYGTLRTDEAIVKWRRARFFRDGSAPSGGGTAPNLALNKTVTASGSDANVPANAVDGDATSRWSAQHKLMAISVAPNPVQQQQSIIRYSLPEAGLIKISVYNMNGQEEVVVNAQQQAGDHQLPWNSAGKPAGTYIACISVGNTVRSTKFVIQ